MSTSAYATRPSDSEILAAFDRLRSQTAVERELGVGRKVVSRLIRERDAAEADISAQVDKSQPEKPAQATIEISIRELKAKLAELEAAVARPATIPAAPVADAPVEKPRVRVKAGTVYAQPIVDSMRPVCDSTDAGGKTIPLGAFSPLGDDRPYQHEVFGVEGKLKPSILAPVSSNFLRVGVIGDTHFHPGIPQTIRQMTLVGLHFAATRPNHVVHIGDSGDWSSACQHTRNDTWKAKSKPSLRQDLDNFRANWAALNRPMDEAGVTSKRHHTHGNHCAWLERFEDAHPETKGLLCSARDGILEEAGWSHTPYGQIVFIGGVGFVHVPLSVMGKPYGGEMPESSISMRVMHDLVYGHTHRWNAVRRVRAGLGQHVQVLNAGGCMPEFYVGDYAQLTAGSAVTSGVLDVDIFDGRIQSFKLATTRELEHRYGDKADDLLRIRKLGKGSA